MERKMKQEGGGSGAVERQTSEYSEDGRESCGRMSAESGARRGPSPSPPTGIFDLAAPPYVPSAPPYAFPCAPLRGSSTLRPRSGDTWDASAFPTREGVPAWIKAHRSLGLTRGGIQCSMRNDGNDPYMWQALRVSCARCAYIWGCGPRNDARNDEGTMHA